MHFMSVSLTVGRLGELKGKPAVTGDGVLISLHANIELPATTVAKSPIPRNTA